MIDRITKLGGSVTRDSVIINFNITSNEKQSAYEQHDINALLKKDDDRSKLETIFNDFLKHNQKSSRKTRSAKVLNPRNLGEWKGMVNKGSKEQFVERYLELPDNRWQATLQSYSESPYQPEIGLKVMYTYNDENLSLIHI